MTYHTWRDLADKRLQEIYDAAAQHDRKPTKEEIYDGYPFRFRQYTPYKIWLEQVKRWERSEPLRRNVGKRPPASVALPGQEALL